VHFKHAREASYTPYDYSLLKKINEYNIPLVINGGINNYGDFLKIIDCVKNKQNIIGFMMGREALRNPDCFIASSNMLNKKGFSSRTAEEVKKEFEDNCKLHLPKEGYVRTIQKYCPWAKDLNIEFPETEKPQNDESCSIGKELKDGKE
jgi:tRNA-dihydrouridine synthase